MEANPKRKQTTPWTFSYNSRPSEQPTPRAPSSSPSATQGSSGNHIQPEHSKQYLHIYASLTNPLTKMVGRELHIQQMKQSSTLLTSVADI